MGILLAMILPLAVLLMPFQLAIEIPVGIIGLLADFLGLV